MYPLHWIIKLDCAKAYDKVRWNSSFEGSVEDGCSEGFCRNDEVDPFIFIPPFPPLK
jgi:hypothetical protein